MRWTIVPMVAALSVAQFADARDADPCGTAGGASDIVSASRDLSACITASPANVAAYCAGLNDQIFGNDQTKLPRAPSGEVYYEGRVGAARDGTPGVRRLVFLVIGTPRTTDAQIAAKYFTNDHYNSFCKLQ